MKFKDRVEKIERKQEKYLNEGDPESKITIFLWVLATLAECYTVQTCAKVSVLKIKKLKKISAPKLKILKNFFLTAAFYFGTNYKILPKKIF